MPTTLIPQNVPGVIGPGLFIEVTTDMIGPIGVDWLFTVEVFTDTDFTQLAYRVERPSAGSRGQGWRMMVDSAIDHFHDFAHDVVDGKQVGVRTTLFDGVTVQDSGQQILVWDTRSGVWTNQVYPPASSSGFTAADRAQLQTIDTTTQDTRQATITTVQTARGTVTVDIGSAFRWISQDFWQERPLSGGVTCERIDYDASLNALYGVQLSIADFPPDTPFRTPDASWSYADLAVLTFLRGDRILQRHGIHTFSHTVAPLPGSMWFGAFGVNAPIQPSNYHITVDWAPGVCGELIGQVLPI